MTDDRMTKTVFLNAAQDKIWAYLTEADKLAMWFHRAESDLAPDQGYRLIGDDGTVQCWGRVTAWIPPRQLSYSFTFGPANGTETQVHWMLDPVQGGTRLTLHHDGIGQIESSPLVMFMALDAGWDQHVGRLRAAIADS